LYGKKWLIYGNNNLNCFAFSTLPEGMMRTSSFITLLKCKTGDPSPGCCTHAIISAMTVMQSRMEGLHKTEKCSWLKNLKAKMMEWKTKASKCQSEYSKLVGKYLASKSKGNKQLLKQYLEVQQHKETGEDVQKGV
jgi:hypothetical protein